MYEQDILLSMFGGVGCGEVDGGVGGVGDVSEGGVVVEDALVLGRHIHA